MRLVFLLSILTVIVGCSTNPAKPACDDLAANCEAPRREPRGLINGDPADPKDWPASVVSSSGGGSCSATVMGPRSVFVAGHCQANGSTISFTAGANSYKAKCTHNPEYRSGSWPGNTADHTMCLTDRDIIGIKYESFGLDKAVKVGDVLRLTGYGCTKPGGTGGNDGVFRIGQATVTQVPTGQSYDIVTRGGAALCFGDSGGAVYLEEGAAGSRWVIATNSRGDIQIESYLSAVFALRFPTWVKSWADTNSAKVCGIHSDAPNCRNSVTPPPNPGDPLFEVSTKAACVKGRVGAPYQSRKNEITDAVKAALEKF